jgi:hypothetical protein
MHVYSLAQFGHRKYNVLLARQLELIVLQCPAIKDDVVLLYNTDKVNVFVV